MSPEAPRVALVCPHAWPPRDDIARHVRHEARALAARGSRVTILAPGTDRAAVAAGREALGRLTAEGPDVIAGEPGRPRELVVARARPAGRGRRLGGPLDVAEALQAALRGGRFDVVHLHEPLAPTPALGVLRAAGCATVATFHRPETLAGAAFLQPLIRRALDRLGARIATGETVLRAARELLPGEYALLRPGVDPVRFTPPDRDPDAPPGLVVVARARERAGLRFALSVLRATRLDALGRIVVIGPPEAPWRTERLIPKALRGRIEVVADAGEETRGETLAGAEIALFPSPEELIGPVLGEAMAMGAAVLTPRSPEVEGILHHGCDGLVLPPFSRREWQEALGELLEAPGHRARLGSTAATRRTGWDDVAEELERLYARAQDSWRCRPATPDALVGADLRLRPPAAIDPAAWVAACRAAGLGAVAVASPHGIGPALAIAAAAPDDLAVVIGQEIATDQGRLIGLFLTREVPGGLTVDEAARNVHEQGGLVLVPHPDVSDAPPAAALRRLGAEVDCWEGLVPSGGRAGAQGARLQQRQGMLVTASSAASTPDQVGAAWTELRPFQGPMDLLGSLVDATLHARPARRRARARTRSAIAADG